MWGSCFASLCSIVCFVGSFSLEELQLQQYNVWHRLIDSTEYMKSLVLQESIVYEHGYGNLTTSNVFGRLLYEYNGMTMKISY
jgi:hypothetical protein